MQLIMAGDRIQTIERSLNCFFCGVVSVLPVIGFPFAVFALRDCFFVLRNRKGEWNPAERYLQIGSLTAMTSIMLTLLLAAIINIEAGR